jgi:hypothetical protein
MAVEPCAPKPLYRHARINTQHAQSDTNRHQREIDDALQRNGGGIALLERVENCSVPNI